MAWTVILENEDREKIDSLDSELEFPSVILKQDGTKLLKYLDPYGDTIFNRNQMNDLLSDLSVALRHEPTNSVINEVIQLANRCASEPHLYLSFYGD